MNPMFSILVPVYNVQAYIHQCLDSIVNQTCRDFEVLLVDDGSTDDSGKICDTYKTRYPDFITVIHKQNEGLLLARRDAIKRAKGDFFVFVDSDDFIELNLLEDMKTIIEDTDCDMVVFNNDKYDGVNFLKYRPTLYDDPKLVTDKHDYYIATLRHKIPHGVWGKIISRRIVDINKDYSQYRDVTIGEDLLQILPYITNAKKIFFTPNVYYHYRVNPSSMTSKFNINNYFSMRKVEMTFKEVSSTWPLENVNQMFAVHCMKDLVWGTLRTLANSAEPLDGDLAKKMYAIISDDAEVKAIYQTVPKNQLDLRLKIILWTVFSKRFNTLKMILQLYRSRKHNSPKK